MLEPQVTRADDPTRSADGNAPFGQSAKHRGADADDRPLSQDAAWFIGRLAGELSLCEKAWEHKALAELVERLSARRIPR